MALMYLHLRTQHRQDQPFDDIDEDTVLMEIDAQHSFAPPDSSTLDDTIMDTYDRLGIA